MCVNFLSHFVYLTSSISVVSFKFINDVSKVVAKFSNQKLVLPELSQSFTENLKYFVKK